MGEPFIVSPINPPSAYDFTFQLRFADSVRFLGTHLLTGSSNGRLYSGPVGFVTSWDRDSDQGSGWVFYSHDTYAEADPHCTSTSSDESSFGAELGLVGDLVPGGGDEFVIGWRDCGRLEVAGERGRPREVVEYPVFVETGTGGGDRAARCGDLDGDGDDELCTTAGVWHGPLAPGGPAPAATWAAEAIAAGDLDGDGAGDLVLARGDAVYWLRGPVTVTGAADLAASAAAAWTADGPVTELAVGDLDGDGDPEVVVGTGAHVTVLEGSLQAPVVALDHAVDALAIGDFDGDGAMDLAVGGDHLLSWVRGPVGAATAFVATFAAPDGTDWALGAALDAADTDGDGVWELAVGAPSSAAERPQGGAVWWLEETWTEP